MVISFLKEDIDCWVHNVWVLISIHGYCDSVPGPPIVLVVFWFLIFIVCLDVSFFGPIIRPWLRSLTVLLSDADVSIVVVLLPWVAPRWPVVVRLTLTPVVGLVLIILLILVSIIGMVLLLIMVVLLGPFWWLFLQFSRLWLIFFQVVTFLAIILIGPIASIVAALSIRIT